MTDTTSLRERLFAFLSRKYVQRQDERQRAMGLQYMEAETHDLANELADFIDAPSPASLARPEAQGEATLEQIEAAVRVLPKGYTFGDAVELATQAATPPADRAPGEVDPVAALVPKWRDELMGVAAAYGSGSDYEQVLQACLNELREALAARAPSAPGGEVTDTQRLDYIERTFSAVTTKERYPPLQMIWSKGCNGRTLREACDKYMKRDAAHKEPASGR